MDVYAEVWERFRDERRLEFGGHMDPTWQDGHTLSASLVLPVDVSPFRERLAPLRKVLDAWPFVSLHPDHFMHVTVLMLGFVVPEPERDKEISPERLADIEVETRRVLSEFPAFDVELKNLNAFPGAAFVEVHDGGRIEALRDTLCGACGFERPSGPPHLTLAYFQAPDGTPAPEGLVSAVGRYREWPVAKIFVDRVNLSLLDLRTGYPVPEVLARMPLKGSGRAGASG